MSMYPFIWHQPRSGTSDQDKKDPKNWEVAVVFGRTAPNFKQLLKAIWLLLTFEPRGPEWFMPGWSLRRDLLNNPKLVISIGFMDGEDCVVVRTGGCIHLNRKNMKVCGKPRLQAMDRCKTHRKDDGHGA